jgi:hypothetical protein
MGGSLEQEEELNLSWVSKMESYLDSSNYEVKRLDKLEVCYVYLSHDMEVKKKETQFADLQLPEDMGVSVLCKNALFEMIQTHKNQYKLFDIQLFHLPLNNENVMSFSSQPMNLNCANQYLKPVNVLNDLHLEPSILLLHDVSKLYVFYKELKSILKLVPVKSIGTTKKVRIQIDENVSKPLISKKSQTRKRRI